MTSFDNIFAEHISKADGWLSEVEAHLLFELARAASDGSIVEVGAYHGKSTIALAAGNLCGNRVPFFSVDPHASFIGEMGGVYGPADRASFLRNIVSAGMAEYVSVISLRSVAASRAIDGPLSLLWIDGDHSIDAVQSDIFAWSGKVRVGGLIALDDVLGPAAGPRAALETLLKMGWALVGELVGKVAVLRREQGSASIEHSSEARVGARNLISASRFDLGAKIPFAVEHAEGSISTWTRWVYLVHIWVWNNFFELTPRKTSAADFIHSFDELLKAASAKNEFLRESLIPVAADETPVNGAHRIAAAAAYGHQLRTITTEVDGGLVRYNYSYFESLFKTSTMPLRQTVFDEMAVALLEACVTGRMLVLFPSPELSTQQAIDALGQSRIIAYFKVDFGSTITCEKFIHLLYLAEPWVGNEADQFAGARYKSSNCFAHGTTAFIFLVERIPNHQLISVKAGLRQKAGRENHSVHSTDTFEDTCRIARSLVFDRTLRFHFGSTSRFPTFSRLFDGFRSEIIERGLESKVVITGSAVLSALELRDCRDIDYLANSELLLNDEAFQSHASYQADYPLSLDTIVSANSLTFWYRGIRFLRPELLRDFKIVRGEEKDLLDVELLAEFGNFHGSELDYWRDVPAFIVSSADPALSGAIAKIVADHPDACFFDAFVPGARAMLVFQSIKVSAETCPDLAPYPILPIAFASAGRVLTVEVWNGVFAPKERLRLLAVDGGEPDVCLLAAGMQGLSPVHFLRMTSSDIYAYPDLFMQGLASFLWLEPSPSWIRMGIGSIQNAGITRVSCG